MVVSLMFLVVVVVIRLFLLMAFLPYKFNFLANSWISDIDLFWGYTIDGLSVCMLFVITFVSFLVQVYSVEYMSHDLNRTRFIGYLSLFVFFMVILVISNNF